ncbi:MAG TPA: hypothetical protein VGI39_04720 [Polyangiaceae bacterium]
MRRLTKGSLGILSLATAGAGFAACGGDPVGLCDFNECQELVTIDSGLGDGNPGTLDGGGEGSVTPGDDASCPADAASTTNCGPSAPCVDTTSSPENCGGCGMACATPPSGNGAATCASSTCGVSCNPGYVVCNGDCLALSGPPANACAVTEAVAIFVSASTGDDKNGDGSQAKPVASIGRGIALAVSGGKPRVYACAGTYPAVALDATVTSGVEVYGGFDCAKWGYADASPAGVMVAPAAGTIPLTVTSVTVAVTFANLTLRADNATAVDSSGNGASSIAAFVAGSSGVNFAEVAFVAGNAVDGKGGEAPGGNYPAGDKTAPGGGGLDPTAFGSITCTDTSASFGGGGGPAPVLGGAPAQSGRAGLWNPAGVTTTPGYDGQPGAAGLSATSHCGSGDPGANGAAGAQAKGAATWGSLGAGGWTPAQGGAAGNGNPAQGGGGGGGSTVPPAAGGGGGAGGCGGSGGTVGAGGGSSFALLSLNSTVTVSSSTLAVGTAGNGGAGGTGQDGEGGGAGGSAQCPGAYGGNGAGGGGGGGGAGGLSVGIAYSGATPTVDAPTTASFKGGNGGKAGPGGTAGAGGENGLGAMANGVPGATGGDGKAGVAAATQGL